MRRRLFTEEGESSLSLTLYPGIQADSMGALSLTGTPAVCTAANAGDYEGWYYSGRGGRLLPLRGSGEGLGGGCKGSES